MRAGFRGPARMALMLTESRVIADKKSPVVKAIEQIRSSRNALAHSTKKRAMPDSDFKAAWAGLPYTLHPTLYTLNAKP